MNALAPTLGDFHITSKDGLQVFLEMKQGHLDISGDRVTHITTMTDRPAFTWRHLRDFLLSFPKQNSEPFALLIPWDKLPSAWRDSFEEVGQASTRSLQPYLLPWTGDWEEFGPLVEERLNTWLEESRRSGDDSHLQKLAKLPKLPIAYINQTIRDTQAQAGRATPPTRYNMQTQIDFACKAASALRRLMLRRYADTPQLPSIAPPRSYP